ncbi:hypothetical protein [Metabacillus fastidiosus]|uniref:hypothetical protein n=1 Tax=Metabacillus fastidiosus TaxID=1458 RepID=UPI003D26E390
MERIERFGVKFEADETPFFQMEQDERIRFGMEVFENCNTKLLTDILKGLFDRQERIDCSFIIGYTYKNKRFREKIRLGDFFKINNWKETVIKNPNEEGAVIYATVKNVKKEEIYKYCKAVSHGCIGVYIAFYNDSFLAYVSTDVLDIMSDNVELIQQLKEQYANVFDKYYEEDGGMFH